MKDHDTACGSTPGISSNDAATRCSACQGLPERAKRDPCATSRATMLVQEIAELAAALRTGLHGLQEDVSDPRAAVEAGSAVRAATSIAQQIGFLADTASHSLGGYQVLGDGDAWLLPPHARDEWLMPATARAADID